MAKSQTSVRVIIGGSEYVESMGERFAEIAIVRTGELTLFKPLWRSTHLPFNFVAVTIDSLCFFIEIISYSACRSKVELDSITALEVEVAGEHLRAARRSPTPIVMLLSDGDREDVRYLRLDTQPKPADDAKTVVLSFPVENTITADSVHALAVALEKERAVPVAG